MSEHGRNRLADATSPYLIQHADNPVDWYPWGDEALARARAEDKPILLSVGYSACHWCHVMAHESFESPRVAAVMNEHFVNIKVDREERPDIDAIYQKVVALMGQGGGWPLTVFLMPDQRPFYGGTYFPPDDRYGRPGFERLLHALADVWANRRDEAEGQAAAFLDGFADIAASLDEEATGDTLDLRLLEPETLAEAGRRLLARFDPEWGGFGRAPKFPNVPSLQLLMALADRGDETAGRALAKSVEAMWRGGIYDHLRGGFARYSVDRRWLIPHFEKMLYDNGLLLGLYADASVREHLGVGEIARRVVEETAAYLEADMRDPDRGWFYSATDADSEGVEGKYFAWTPAQLRAVLGEDRAALVMQAHGVPDSPEGNFEHGMSVLHRPEPIDEPTELALAPMRAELLAARAERVPPLRDEKVLTAWNALVISGLCKAADAAERWPDPARAEHWTELAETAATAVLEVHRDPRLLRASWRGRGHTRAFLEDVALMARACLDLHARTLAPRWRDTAIALAEEMLAHYARPGGGFFMTADDAEALVERTESQHDSPIPSGVAVAIEVLARLDESSPRGHVDRTLHRFRTAGARPSATAALLVAAAWAGPRATHVTVRGPSPTAAGVQALASVARTHRDSPLALSFSRADETSALVCRAQSCSLPLRTVDSLRDALL